MGSASNKKPLLCQPFAILECNPGFCTARSNPGLGPRGCSQRGPDAIQGGTWRFLRGVALILLSAGAQAGEPRSPYRRARLAGKDLEPDADGCDQAGRTLRLPVSRLTPAPMAPCS